MKIIQVIPVLSMGGAEIMCENLTCELKALGHEVIVVSLYDIRTPITQRLESAGVDIRYLGKKRGIDLSMYKKLRALFKAESPDAVHTHLRCTQYVFPLTSCLKIKTVHTIHNVAQNEAPKLLRRINGFFYKFKKAVPVALSDIIQETAQREYHLDKTAIPVILNGIDLSRCVKKESYETNGNFKIVHIGRFFEQKNHEGLILAFEIFHQKHPDTELHLIGDGHLRSRVEELVQEKKMGDCVKFYGTQANVHTFLHEMDIFTLPSLYEGIPITIIEAMGTGLPIVATSVGGVPNMLENGETAILTAVDSKELAEAYSALYEDQQLREKLGKNALTHSSAFSSAEMAQQYESIYRH